MLIERTQVYEVYVGLPASHLAKSPTPAHLELSFERLVSARFRVQVKTSGLQVWGTGYRD